MKSKISLGESTNDQNCWQMASHLIEARQYASVSEFLRELQETRTQTNNAVFDDVLAAASTICSALMTCHAEVEQHRQAYDKACERELALKQQLCAMLALVSNRRLSKSDGERGQQPVPTRETQFPHHDFSKAASRPKLWQRIQSLLGRKPLARSMDYEQSIVFLPDSPRPTIEEPRTSDDRLLVAELSKATAFPVEESVTVDMVKDESSVTSSPKFEDEVSTLETKQDGVDVPSLFIYCLGPFRVYQNDQSIEVWPSSKGKSIFKYLVMHRERPVAKEILMETFWPDAPPDAARNNLNVAIYGLRQALRKGRPAFSHVLFREDCYLLNPLLRIWVDCEAFVDHLHTARSSEQRGDQDTAVREYRAAEALYQGEFLEEDRYEDWLVYQRQCLRDDYIDTLDCLSCYYFGKENYGACRSVCNEMLFVDDCREDAHRLLMRCYSRQGQPYLALRQYHMCVETLAKELDVSPTFTTTELYERIRRGEHV